MNENRRGIALEQKKNYRTTKQSNRIKLLAIFFVIVLILLLYALRLIQYQIVDRDIVVEQASAQLVRKIPYEAMRGEILDRHGNVLAFSRATYDVEIVHEPGEVREDLINKIVDAYPDADAEEMKLIMASADEHYVTVLEDLPVEIANTIAEVDLRYVGVISRFKRIYPNGNLASNILGTLSRDGEGQSGIEEWFDEELSGTDGYIETKTDLFGRRNPYSDAVELLPSNGRNINLTIDAAIQHFVQTIVAEERVRLGAKDVMAVVQDSKNAEILAMASSYTYDPNEPYNIVDENLKKEYDAAVSDEEKSAVLLKMWKNPFVSMTYEPGSTMKIFVSLAALEENIVSSNTPFQCGGFTMVDGEQVRCVTYPGSHGNLSFKDGFRYSCNVVFAKVAAMLGKDRFYKYLDEMNLLENMDMGLPMNESPIYIPKDKLYDVDFAKMAFGHAISLTPLHVANIAQVVSNNGDLILPSMVKSIGSDERKKKNVGQIFSQQTTQTVREYMEAASQTYPKYLTVPGYRVGSKTGTSVKFVDGEYNDDFVTTSVIQISPITDPSINVIVIVDEPKEELSSMATAGSIASKISAECLRYLKIAPNSEDSAGFLRVPNFVGKGAYEALIEADSMGLRVRGPKDKENTTDEEAAALRNDFMQRKGTVVEQSPLEGALVSEGSEIVLTLSLENKEENADGGDE